MSPLDGVIGLAEWAGRDTAYNLGFIPEDKLAWKPAETAKSVVEVTNEIIYVLNGMVDVIKGGAWPEPDPTKAVSDLADLQEGVKQATANYIAALKTLTPEDLDKEATLPFGTFPMARFATFALAELLHHRGQIVYVQSLLGDAESHMLMD